MTDAPWLARLAGYGLPGAPSPGKPDLAVADVLGGARQHRLVGVLHAAVAEGPVPLPDHERATVAEAHEQAMRESLLLEDVLLRALATLSSAGVEARVLKGSALAHLAHPDPAERTFGDNDLLVPAGQIDRAVEVLIGSGGSRPVPALSRDFDRRFAKSVTLSWHGPSELDLHRTLVPGPYGLMIDLDDLWRDPIDYRLAGVRVPTVALPLHLLHGALHVALGDVSARYGNLRDVALLARTADIDVDAVVRTAERWGCVAPLAWGLQRTAPLGHTRSPVERWADGHELDAEDLRRLAVYRDRRRRFRRQAVASLRVLGWRDRVAYVRALASPRRAIRPDSS